MEAYNELLKQVKKPERPPYGNPWNPSYIIIISFFLPFIATSIGLALNWRRLGKPKWALPTLFVGIIGTIALVIGVIFGLPYFDFNSRLSTSLFAFLFAIPLSFFVAVAQMQTSAYKAWQQYHDFDQLVTYSYPWRTGVLMVVVMIAIAVGVANWQFSSHAPRTYQGTQFSVDYTPPWDALDKQKICTYGCELILGDTPLNYTTILFEQFPFDNPVSSKKLYQSIWPQLLEEHPNYEVVNFVDGFQIDGRDVVYVEYYEKHDDGKDQAYFGQYYVALDQVGVVITARSDIPGIFREDRKRIEEVINSIKFNNGSKPV